MWGKSSDDRQYQDVSLSLAFAYHCELTDWY
jgi:hypothetical protein